MSTVILWLEHAAPVYKFLMRAAAGGFTPFTKRSEDSVEEWLAETYALVTLSKITSPIKTVPDPIRTVPYPIDTVPHSIKTWFTNGLSLPRQQRRPAPNVQRGSQRKAPERDLRAG